MSTSLPEPVTAAQVRKFFARSDWLDHEVLRPLSHIKGAWELTWDHVTQEWEPEADSFAEEVNRLVERLATTSPPERYHDNEDALAGYVVETLGWPIRKERGRWVGADYGAILEQGGFDDIDQSELTSAATGRVHAAIRRGQPHIDDMEEAHQKMLGAVLTIILFHRFNTEPYTE